MPTDETVPKTFWVALPTVMRTWLPALIRPTSEASTDACTSYEPVLTRWIAAALVPADAAPDPDPPPAPDEDPDPDPPTAPDADAGPGPGGRTGSGARRGARSGAGRP